MPASPSARPRRLLRRFLILLLALLLIAAAAFLVWASTPLGPEPTAGPALQSDAEVRVDRGDWLVFWPAQSDPVAGFIFYPGGRVDYRSYAPPARAIAAAGFLVVIPRMPLNLAFTQAAAADAIIAAYPRIQTWAIGGHSLGGAMAARYAYQQPDQVEGLALWAAYPAATDDLTTSGLAVVSIYADQDGLATPDKIANSQALLPAAAQFVRIAGGNHAQFGAYGPQPGDGLPAISAAEQHAQIVAATLQLLRQLSPEPAS